MAVRIVTFYTFVVGLLCACTSHISTEIPPHQQTPAQISQDELDLFVPQDEDEAAIKAILGKIKEAYMTCDKTLLMSVFAQDYEQAVVIPYSPAMIISRAEYFAAVSMAKANETECRKLQRNLSITKIRIVRPKTPSDSVEVVLRTTYGSKYFNPRFSEKFIFHRGAGKMLVGKRMITSLHPKSPEDYQAEIYIGDYYKYEKYKTNLQQMAWEDGDIFIERILGGTSYQTLSVDHSPKSVIVVFREPPPLGAKVKIAQWYYNTGGQLRITSEDNDTVERVNAWFFLVTQTTTFATGEVNYEVFVDEARVLEKTYAAE